MLPRGLTVFAPVYNEEELLEKNVLRLLEYLNSLSLGVPFEILIGSNGSTDKTAEIASALCVKYPTVRFFHLNPKGVGTAFARGVQEARYNRIITVDMDLSIDLAFIPQAFCLLEQCDMVVGAKVTGEQKRPWLRKSVSNLFIQLARILLKIQAQDYSIAAKGYKTSLAKKYLPHLDAKTFYVVTIVYCATKDGLVIKEIPVDCFDMRDSRFNLIHEGFYKFGHLFLLWLRNLAR